MLLMTGTISRSLVRILRTSDIYSPAGPKTGPRIRAFRPDNDGTISLFAGAPGTPLIGVVEYLRNLGSRRQGTPAGYCVLDEASVRTALLSTGGVLQESPNPGQEAHGVEHWIVDVRGVATERTRDVLTALATLGRENCHWLTA